MITNIQIEYDADNKVTGATLTYADGSSLSLVLPTAPATKTVALVAGETLEVTAQ